MKKIQFTSALAIMAVLSLSLGSCRRDHFGCIRAEGTSVTESRAVDNFTKVDIMVDAVVYIYEDSVFSFTANGPQNIIDNLEINVSGDRLIVRQDRCVRHRSNLSITIHAPVVADVELSGSAQVKVYKAANKRVSSSRYEIIGSGDLDIVGAVKTDNLFVKITGSGNIDIPADVLWASMNITGSGKINSSGTAVSCENYISGSGKIEAYELETKDNYVEIAGSGRTNVYATSNLDVDITGSGSVYYKGWPTTSTRISGSGKVVHVN